MSGIVLSNAVRQNLSSLQATADLLATTQSRLSTGKKVNTALDNPTNFFTAASLDSRASDINNLLDGIGNGIQIIQAANTGISSLTKLVDSAKSIANQALQSVAGYTSKSSVSTTIAGATADDLRGTSTYTNGLAQSIGLQDGAGSVVSSNTQLGGVKGANTGAAVSTLDATNAADTLLSKLGSNKPVAGDTLTVNGRTITFASGDAPGAATLPTGSGVSDQLVTDGKGNSTVYLNSGKVSDVLKAIDLASGVRSASITGGNATITHSSGDIGSVDDTTKKITLSTSTGSDLSISGNNTLLSAFGLNSGANGTGTFKAERTADTTAGAGVSRANMIQADSTLTVNGKTITFKDAALPSAADYGSGKVTGKNVITDGNGNSTVFLQGGKIDDVLTAIDIASGAQTAPVSNGTATLAVSAGSEASKVLTGGQLQLSSGLAGDLNITGTGNALSALGLAGNQGTATSFSVARTATAGGITGKTLSFESFNGGSAVNVTIGDGTNGTVKSLADLNAKLAANNMTASIDTTGKLTISASNDYASSRIGSAESGGKIGGTAAALFSTPTDPVADVNAQTTRANLVTQYNNIIEQIKTTAQDASFNGVNLLGGDTLKLVFNETGKSTLSIQGVTFDPAGLGLSSLKSGKDFIDNASTNKVISALNTASTTLRSQASALGSNLSIVQTRQDFSKNLINVLQTGSSNLTLADTNEEAANSQALSTRQSIAVSALSLANSSQQSVLQLLR
jgi:flagellin-like hook-associated protein FlgL